MVAAYSLGEENILAHLCLLFEALVLSTSRRIRYFKGEALPRPGVNGNGGGVSSSTTSSHPIATVGRPEAGAAGGGGRLVEEGDNNAAAAAAAAAIGGLRVSTALGDALAEAFRRHPFHRFLVSLRCITAELPKLGRSFTSADPGVAAAPPDMSLRASEWVDQSLWAAAAGVAVGGSNGMVVGSGNEHNSNRSSTDSIGGGGAPPELVEALFKLMAEWVKELPVPSLRWLEAWLSVAVSGLAVRHRGPARAVLGLIQACCSQRKSPQFTATFSALLRGTALGVALTRGLLSGMCGAMPSWMLDDHVLTVQRDQRAQGGLLAEAEGRFLQQGLEGVQERTPGIPKPPLGAFSPPPPPIDCPASARCSPIDRSS
ncbi:expressed unknown protein [Ectocarpus siliculosus]|uniref:Uncharacterized protein n=1 Tax=Ectocarpus siliculosus TaxID=2880 RepID=D7FSA3_ECTSI|nr:expressed unknown protein [Ectocarpus siliculosus]|eukprot:CBJ31044.1 expressed unknown protein [Ectocarpus siliculosus]